MLDIYKPLAYDVTMTSKELKQWREVSGYSQDKLAKALSVHIMTVSRWERGAREIPPFLKLALGYLELKEDKPKQELKTKSKPKLRAKPNKVKKEAIQPKQNIYGEYLQTWNRFLTSVLPKW